MTRGAPAEAALETCRTLAALALLTSMLPVNLALTVPALLHRRRGPVAPPGTQRRTVLVSGGKMTKALHLCRAFSAAGHRVVLVETAKYRLTGHRFSRAVDAFHVVPPPAHPDYAQALLRIVRDEHVDVYVPVCSPTASRYDALAAGLLAPHCQVLHAYADLVDLLDDKFRFAEAAAGLGLAVPDTHLVTEPADVAHFDFAAHPVPYVLKSIAYDPVNRLDLTQLPRAGRQETERFAVSKPIATTNPWILQEYVSGREWCVHTTAVDGRVVVYVCCPSSAFQVNYESAAKPDIEAWVFSFVAALHLTGQVSFDFLESRDGTARAIECNPRAHSAVTTFQDLPALAAAYLGQRSEEDGPLRPPDSYRPTYWLYHQLWRAVTDPRAAPRRFAEILRGKDAVYDWNDPLPFLLLHHLQIPSLLVGNLLARRPWTRIDFNIGKLVEPGGD